MGENAGLSLRAPSRAATPYAGLSRLVFTAAPGAFPAASATVVPGHDFGRLAVPPAPVQRRAAGGVIQRAGSDSEESSESESEESGSDSDEGSDWEAEQKSAKVKKPDPRADMTGKPSVSTSGKKVVRKYSTLGGAMHEQTEDPDTFTTTTVTSGLTPSLGYRNDAKRPPKDSGYYAFNHFGLSVGQAGRNQAVGSHQTPSWLGMRAGGEYRNVDMTSSEYNKRVEKGEKKWREKIKKTHKYRYETATQKEEIASNPRVDEIAKQPGVRWSKDRIKKRLGVLTAIHPKETRVVGQKRKFGSETTGEEEPPLDLGVDYHYGLPARAFSEDAQKRYVEERGEESSGSDSELKPQEPKKKKKKTT